MTDNTEQHDLDDASPLPDPARPSLSRKQWLRLALAAAAVVALTCVLFLVWWNGAPGTERIFRSGMKYFEQHQYDAALIQFRRVHERDSLRLDALHQMAICNAKLGRLDDAIHELALLVEKSPADLGAHLDLAEYFLSNGQIEDSAKEIDAVKKLDPGNARAQSLTASGLLLERKFSEAQPAYQLALKLSPNDPQLWIGLGLSAIGNQDNATAEAALQSALRLKPASVEANRDLANLFELEGHVEKSEDLLRRVTAQYPSSLELNIAWADFLYRHSRFTELDRHLAAIASRDSSVNTILELGEFWNFRGQVAQAVVEFEKAFALDPSLVTRKKLISAYLTLSQLDKVDPLLAPLLREHPEDADGRAFDGMAACLRGNYEEAAFKLNEALKENPRSLMAHYYLGLAELNLNQVQSSRGEFEQTLKLNANFGHAELQLAKISLLENRPADAADFARRAAISSPGLLDAYLVLAQAEIAAKNLPEAKRALDYASAIAPGGQEVQLVLARWALANKDTAQARKIYEQLLASSHDPVHILAEMTASYRSAGQLPVATDRVSGWISANPPNAAANQLLAESLLDQNRIPAAYDAAHRAVQLDPNSADARLVLGRALLSLRKPMEAAAQFDLAMQANPTSWTAPLYAADLALDLGDYPRARGYLEVTRRLNGNAIPVKREGVRLAAETGQELDVALSTAQDILRQTPDDAELRQWLGWIYFQRGLDALAMPELKAAASALPTDAQAQYHLGMALAHFGRKDEARAALSKALRIGLTPKEKDDAAQKALAAL